MTIFSSKIAGATSLGLLVTLAFTGCSSHVVYDKAPTEKPAKTPSHSATAKVVKLDKALQLYYKDCGIKAGVTWESTQANKIKINGEEKDIKERRDARCPGTVDISFLNQDRQADSTSQIPKSVTWKIKEDKLPLVTDQERNVRLNASINITYSEGKAKSIKGDTVIVLNKRDDGYYLTYEDTASDPYEQATTIALTDAIQNTSSNNTAELW